MKRLRRLLVRYLSDARLRRAIAGLSLTAAVLLGLTSSAMAATGGHGAGEPHINWWTWDMHAPPVGWFMVDFVIFVALLVYFTRKPVSRAFAQRHATIKQSIAEAAATFTKVKARHEEYRGKLAGLEAEIKALLSRAEEDGQAERDRIIANAKDLGSRLRKDSATLAEQEVERARQRLRSHALDAALRAAEQRLRSELGQADKERLLEQAIVELETAKPARGAVGRSRSVGDAA